MRETAQDKRTQLNLEQLKNLKLVTSMDKTWIKSKRPTKTDQDERHDRVSLFCQGLVRTSVDESRPIQQYRIE